MKVSSIYLTETYLWKGTCLHKVRRGIAYLDVLQTN